MNFVISNKITEPMDWSEVNVGLISKKKCLVFAGYNKTLSEKKTVIDSDSYNSEWDKMKKVANTYELIYTTYSKKKKKESIANYKPISRSFYKLWEMNKKFNLLDLNVKDHYISNLAEGPGGFMEALVKEYSNDSIKLFGLTLPPHNKYIPDWSKMKTNLNMKNINISYGDLYKWEDIKKYLAHFNNKKCSLVTADGGFDYSSNFNGQEIDSYKIIFSEMFVAMLVLAQGGNFVCKFFDIYSLFSLKLIYILTKCFREVYIFKPETSRPANSEKYLVCKGFVGLTHDSKTKIMELFEKIESIPITTSMVLDLKGVKLSNDFIHTIDNMNKEYLKNQIYYIDKIVGLIEDKNFNDKYDSIVCNQVKNAVEWCERNNMKINKASEFYIKYYITGKLNK